MTDPSNNPADPGGRLTEARIRRAPRLPVFLALGAVLGAVVALVLTAVGNVDPAVGFGATFGYLCVWCVPTGLLVGAVVAVLIDQVSRRRARLVTVERASVEAPAVESPADEKHDEPSE